MHLKEAGGRMDGGGGAIWMKTWDMKWNNILAEEEAAPTLN